MASIGDIWLALRGDGSPLLKDAKREGEKAGTTAGKGFVGKMKAQLSGVKGGILAGLGIGAGFGAFQAAEKAIGAVTDAIFKSVDAASDQREAMALTEQVFEDSSDTMEDWAETAADSFGESKTAALNYAAGFGNVMRSTGEDIDEVAEKSRELTERAADLGSAFNASGEEVATALKAGLVGEAEPLRRFGILLNANAVAAEAYAMGIAGVGDELTEGQKVQARYSLIMKQSSKSAGMFGRDTGSLADAQKSLNAVMEDLSAEAGEVLIPVFVDLAKTLKDDVLPGVRDFIDALKGTGDVAADNQDIIGNLANLLHDLFKDPSEDARTFLGETFDFFNSLLGYTDEYYAKQKASALETARETSRGNEIMQASLRDTGTAYNETGEDVLDFKSKVQITKDTVVISAAAMIAASRGMRDAWLSDVTALINDYFDPIITRQNLQAVNAEITAQREIIASETATDAEIADAERRLTELLQTKEQTMAELLAYGKLTQAEFNSYMRSLWSRFNSTTDRMEREAIALQMRLMALRDIWNAGIGSKAGIGGNWNPPGFASGGFVSGGQLVEVGERGREWFVPGMDGTIIPNHVVEAVESGSGSGVTNQFGVEIHGYPLQASTPLGVVRELRRAAALMVPPRLDEPMEFRR